jgi:hypothetical protein
MNKLILTIITFLTLNLALTAYAATETLRTSGAFGHVLKTFSNDCQFSSVEIQVSENSSRTNDVKTGFHSASFSYFVDDSCTNRITVITGATDIGIDFQKAPRSITSSGSVPVTVGVIDKGTGNQLSDEESVVNLTNLVFTQSSELINHTKGTSHSTQQVGALVIKKTSSTSDDSFSSATVSGTIFIPLDSTEIELSTDAGTMGNSRSRSTTITR